MAEQRKYTVFDIVSDVLDSTIDSPIKRFQDLCWPDLEFDEGEQKIIDSVAIDCGEDVVTPNPSFQHGLKPRRDLLMIAFISLWYFRTHQPVKVVIACRLSGFLDALWDEIRRLDRESRYDLGFDYTYAYGRVHCGERWKVSKFNEGLLDVRSCMLGVAVNDNGPQVYLTVPKGGGALYVAYGIPGNDNEAYTQASAWATHKLIIE